MHPPSIRNLIKSFKELPSVGERTAERFVFHLLKSGKKEVTELILALKELVENVKSCEVCWNFSETSPCQICADTKRDQSSICVVADPQNVAVIEQTGGHRGTYHVLRGLVDPGDDQALQKMKIKELFERAKNTATKEIILALNPDLAGETTMLYITKEINRLNHGVKVTHLARGLPLGADVRYADEITLASALKNRTEK